MYLLFGEIIEKKTKKFTLHMKYITLVGMHATLTQDKFVIWN